MSQDTEIREIAEGNTKVTDYAVLTKCPRQEIKTPETLLLAVLEATNDEWVRKTFYGMEC